MLFSRRNFLTVSGSSAACLFLNSVSIGQSEESAAADSPSDSPSDSNSRVSPHLNEVLSLLNVEIPGETPLERQTALLDSFRNRKVVSAYLLLQSNLSESFSDVGEAAQSGETAKLAAEKVAKCGYSNRADDALQHIFPGQPAYPSDFRGKDEIDWDSNPQKDKEWLWQFHRFYWLEPLAGAYVRTHDEKYAAEWAFEMRSWIEHMHRPENAFNHPGWRSLDTAIRMKTWAVTLEFFLKSPALDGALLADVLWSLDVHCQRIAERCRTAQNRDGDLGNWDIFHVEGLLFTAAALPERKKSTEEIQMAAELMVAFQKRVLLDDGVINEFIPSYHSAYPGQFARLVRVCRSLKLPVEIPQEFMDRLEKSINAMAVWSHPDGTSPVFGDAWLGSRDGNRRWILPFLPLFDRPDWRWFASKGQEGAPPASRMQELPAAGYYTMRSDWTENALFLVTKNSKTTHFGHNQADNLTFELSAYGQRLMTDSGCYNYSGEPEWRQFFRSPAVHQLVSLDEQPIQSCGRKIVSRSISASETFPSMEVLTLENEPVPGLTHRRTFLLADSRFFVIFDELSGSASGQLRQHFQFLPGEWTFQPEQLRAFTQHPNAPNLLLVGAETAAQPAISLEEEDGWISTRYMQKERRPAFAFTQSKSASETVRFSTLLFPTPTAETLPPEIHFTVETDFSSKIRIGEKTWNIPPLDRNGNG